MTARLMLVAFVALGLLSFASVSHADFYLHKTIDLTGVFGAGSPNGVSPMSVAYDGTSAFVGGYNESGAASTVSIVRVDNLPLGQISTFTPLAGSVIAANHLEGYNSVVLGSDGATTSVYGGKDNANLGGNVIVSVDPITGALMPAFGTAGVLTNPGGRTRMHGGISFDPGFGGVGFGVSHLESGQGRRQQVDATTGAEVYGISGDPTPGFVVFISTLGSVYRGHAYDPTTGDLYIRTKNNVQKSVRTGANTAAAAALIVDLVDADTIIGQNVEVIGAGTGSGGQKLIIYNDRSAIPAGQSFSTTVLLSDASGAATAAQLLDAFGAALALPDGNALYDFAYSSTTDTLIVSDFYNRKLYLFENTPVPEPGSLAVLASGLLGSVFAMRRRR